MDNIIYISTSEQAVNETVTLGNVVYKSDLRVVLDLGGVYEQSSKALNVTIDWGDGTKREVYNRQLIYSYKDNSIADEIEGGRIGGTILTKYNHIFTPAPTHVSKTIIQVLINYDDGTYTLLKQPVTLIRESYHDSIVEFSIVDAGIHDNGLYTVPSLQSKHNKRSYLTYLKRDNAIPVDILCLSPGKLNLKKYEISTPNDGVNYSVGEDIRYRVNVQNIGGLDITTEYPIKDDLEGISITSDIYGLSAGGVLLEPREIASIEYTYTVALSDLAVGSIENIAYIGTDYSNRLVISNLKPPPALEIEKSAVVEDGYINYTVTATNPDVVPAVVKLIDSLPVDQNDVISGAADFFTGTTIPANQSKTVTYAYQLDTEDLLAGSITNIAELSSTAYPTVSASVTTPLAPLQNLEVTKTIAGGTLQFNETVLYSVNISNPNVVAINNVVMEDSLPGVGVNSVVGGEADVFTGVSIPAGGSVIVNYEYTIPASYIGQSEIVNTVTVTGDGVSPSTATATGQLTEPPKYQFTIDTTKQFDETGPYMDYSSSIKAVDLAGFNAGETFFYIDKPQDIPNQVQETDQSSFRLPLIDSGVYDFYVDWGDGSGDKITSYNDSNAVHTYNTAGVKTVTIYGIIKGWKFANTGDRLKYIDTIEWTALHITTPDAFYGCENYTGNNGVNVIGSPTIDTADLSRTFAQCYNFNGSVSNWNVSGVTNMYRMFIGCCKFNNTGTSGSSNNTMGTWDTSNVTTMQQMFAWCPSFNQSLDQNWNVNKVTSFEAMFLSCRNFNRPLNLWNIYSVTGSGLNNIFSGCFRFNRNLNSWSQYVSGATGLSQAFKKCYVFNNGNATSMNWDVSNVKSFYQMFATDIPSSESQRVGPLDTPLNGVFNCDISNWVVESAETLDSMFWNQHLFNSNISGWGQYLSNIKNNALQGTFLDARKFNRNLDTWGPWVSACTNLNNTFSRAYEFNNGDVAGGSSFPMNTWDTRNVEIMAGTFSFTNNFNQDISSWDVRKVVDMNAMFASAIKFNKNLDSWAPQVSSVENMSNMFQSAIVFNNGDVAGGSSFPMNWDVSSVTNMSEMFRGAFAFDQPIDSWNVSSVTNMSTMFDSASTFNRPLNTWNVSNVTNMSNMFASTTVFNQPLNNWNVSNVTNMEKMFFFSNFNRNIGSWNVGNVTNMKGMFDVVDSTATSKLSQTNYENLLNGWAGLTPNLQFGVTLDVQQVRPSGAAGAYNTLTTTHGWTINDKSS